MKRRFYFIGTLLLLTGLMSGCGEGGSEVDGTGGDGGGYYVVINSVTSPANPIPTSTSFNLTWNVSWKGASGLYEIGLYDASFQPAINFANLNCGGGALYQKCPSGSGTMQCQYIKDVLGYRLLCDGTIYQAGMSVNPGAKTLRLSACVYDASLTRICDSRTFNITLSP